MPAPLSIDLRERIAEAYLVGDSKNAEVAERFQVSVTTVERLGRRAREGRSMEPDTPTGRPPMLAEKHYEWIVQELARDPYLSSYELTARFRKRFRSLRPHRSTILRAMHELEFTFKKNSVRTAAGPTRRG